MFNKLKERKRFVKYREAINKDIWGCWDISEISEDVKTQVHAAINWLNKDSEYYKLCIDITIVPICRMKEI